MIKAESEARRTRCAGLQLSLGRACSGWGNLNWNARRPPRESLESCDSDSDSASGGRPSSSELGLIFPIFKFLLTETAGVD
jgi:hypothetical protein